MINTLPMNHMDIGPQTVQNRAKKHLNCSSFIPFLCTYYHTYPIVRLLDSEKRVLQGLEQIIKGFRAAITKKTHKMAKKSHFLAQNSVFGA